VDVLCDGDPLSECEVGCRGSTWASSAVVVVVFEIL
jgi:hypothetical protein